MARPGFAPTVRYHIARSLTVYINHFQLSNLWSSIILPQLPPLESFTTTSNFTFVRLQNISGNSKRPSSTVSYRIPKMAPGWWCHVCDAHGLKAWHHDANKKCPCGHTKCSRCRLESIGTPRPRAAPAQQQGHSLENPATHNGDGSFAVGDNGGAMLGQTGNWNGDGAFDSAVLFGGHQEVDRGLEGLGEMKMEEDGLFDF